VQEESSFCEQKEAKKLCQLGIWFKGLQAVRTGLIE